MAGACIPLTPAVHQMIDIGPVPRFEDAKRAIEFPIVRDMDTNMYERQDGTSLEIGSYAHRAILYDPEDLPSVEEAALSPTEFPFTQEDFAPQLEHALELMPEIVGDESVGIKYAINGILSLTPDGMPILGETPEVKGLWSAAAVWVKEGPGVGKALAEWMVHGESEIDLHSSDVARFHDHHQTSAHVKARTAEGFNKTYGIVHPLEQWESNRNVRLSPFNSRERELDAVFFEAAGWERPQWYESNAPLLEEFGDRVGRREAEWDSRWWSPIINAEHLAMRDRAGLFDLSAFAIFDVSGPGALDALQRGLDASGRRRGRPRRVHAMALAERRLQVRPHDHAARGRALPGRHRRRARYGGQEVAARPPPGGRLGPARRPHVRLVHARDLGPARPRHPRECHERRRLARGLPVRNVPDDRDRAASRARVADLLRRRPRLGAVRPDRAGRAPVGHPLGGRQRARSGAGRDRRLRHDRPAREVLSRLRHRARERVHRGRGRDGHSQGEGAGLRRQGGIPRGARGGAGHDSLHAHRRRSRVVERRCALSAGARAGRDLERRTHRRRQRPRLVRDECGRRPVDRQAHPHGVPPAGARRGGAKLAVEYMGDRYPITVAVAGPTPLFDPENVRVRS